jgi:hypothetical protein
MEPTHSCIGFAIDCGTIAKGAGVVVMAFILFVGSIYLLLTAIFGRWMGYLVTIVAFSGWMIIHSSLWLFGFWDQGLVTPTNVGPKGADPTWVVLDASAGGGVSDKYPEFAQYPGGNWREPDLTNKKQAADVLTVQSSALTFLAQQANIQLGIAADDPTALTTTSFTVDDLKFDTSANGTPIAVVQAHFNGGGPLWTVSLYYDSGSVPRYSYMFLGASIILFGIHVPLLDRAEKRRKEFLTGGSAPAWYGPA